MAGRSYLFRRSYTCLLIIILQQQCFSVLGQDFSFPEDKDSTPVAAPAAAQTEAVKPQVQLKVSSLPSADCKAIGGPSNGLPCLFPFIFADKTFDGCITLADPDKKPWCSTKVDANGVHTVGGNHFGHCDPAKCPISKDPAATAPVVTDTTGPGTAPGSSGGDNEGKKADLESFVACQTKDGKAGHCKPISLCIGLTHEQENSNSCELEAGKTQDLGICCSEVTKNVEQVNLAKKETPAVQVSGVSQQDVDNFVEVRFAPAAAAAAAAPPAAAAPGSSSSSSSGTLSTATQFHLRFNRPSAEALAVDSKANGLQKAASDIQSTKSLSNNEAGIGLRMFNADNNDAIKSNCPWIPGPTCDPSAKYRTVDGTCNNVNEPSFGRANTPFQRILLPVYASGSISLPRRQQDGVTELPSARLVSNVMTKETNVLDSIHTTLLMNMGQFIDHDLTHTPNHGEVCCDASGQFPASFDADKCFPIPIPADDPFWSVNGGQTCMSFARSLSSPGLKCSLEFRQQITHWLDGSNIYGSDDTTRNGLRQLTGGLLKVTRQTGLKGGLPSCSGLRSENDVSMCIGCSTCIFTGDVRANEQLNLIVMHTVWMREHNRMANLLRRLNPSWDDEMLFQEAKRITVAEYQHIIYKEWLPIVLGNEFMTSFGLWPLSKGFSSTYRADVDPRITNEFATAAFRFGHSLVPATVDRVRPTTSGRGLTTKLNMRELFFKPEVLKEQSGMLDDLLRGLTTQENEIWDQNFVKDIKDHLFESSPGSGGLDLVALNVQRGRDHGLPGYNSYREICQSGGGRARDWPDLADDIVIPQAQVDKLKTVYASVDDVDLFVGGFLELPHADSILGPTFKCILGDAFARLKLGDRFFYDLNVDPNISFTEPQLQEIRKTSMARIICDNADGVTRVQPQVFRTPGSSKSNNVQSCNSINIPSVNMGVFAQRFRNDER